MAFEAEIVLRPGGAPDGAIRRASIRTYGDTIHSFIERGDYEGFLPGYALDTVRGSNVGIHCVDHVVGNVELGKMPVPSSST